MIMVHDFFDWINSSVLAVPSTILFFGASIILTYQSGFAQLRGFPRFFRLIISGVPTSKKDEGNTISSFGALFTAMATTIGMGNVVSPTLAIMIGGPGALFWLLFYMLFGSVIKYSEVVYALETRKHLPDGFILGGPIQYLKSISTRLSNWYGYIIIFVIISWSCGQSNTLANVMALEGVPHWMVGATLSGFVVLALSGGAQRVSAISSKLVPVMFVLYVFFALSILMRNPLAVMSALRQMFNCAFNPSAAVGGFFGASVFRAMREGIFRGIFITEAGIGTSSIAHSLADTKNPTDQGILAMISMLADVLLSMLSGMLVLITGIWSIGAFRSTLIYEVFKLNAPGIGQYVLMFSVTLFVLTTVMGNSFNGLQSCGILVKDDKFWMAMYVVLTVTFIFIGALIPMKLLWDVMDTLLMLVAVPNVIGVLILAFKRPRSLQIKN